VVNAFLDFSAGGLSRAEALTWLVLWRDTKPAGTAQTSQADLARRIGANSSTVKRAVAALVKAGLLAVVYRGSLHRGPSAYCVRPLPWERVTPTRLPPGR
jgi:predicted transcriptional regulator